MSALTTATPPRTSPPARSSADGTTGTRRVAVTGGVSLLAMAVVAVPANLAVQRVLGADGPAAAASWVAGHAGTMRLAVVALLAAAALDVVVAWSLTTVLRPAGEALATLAGWVRVAYAAMFVAAIGHLASAVRSGTGGADADATWVAAHAFGDGWQLALAVFGVHLVLVGALLVRTRAPRLLAGVVTVAGVAYLVDALLRLLVVDPGVAGTVSTAALAVSGLVAEVWLALWLLVRAGR